MTANYSPRPYSGEGQGVRASLADHSWQDAASDIRFRQGILAILTQQYEAGLRGPEAGRQRPSFPGTGAGVNQLPSLFRTGAGGNQLPSPVLGRGAGGEGRHRSLAPLRGQENLTHSSRVGSTDRGVGLALALGRIAALLGREIRPPCSSPRCNRGVIKGDPPPRSRLRPWGWPAMIALNDPVRAKEAYLLSLKASEKPAWHDETLREFALLIERQGRAVVPPLGGIWLKAARAGASA